MSSAVSRIGYRQFRAQLRTVEWRVLMIAALLAVTLTSFLSVVSNRMEAGLLRESAAVLGSDLQLTSSRPIEAERIDLAKSLGLTTTSVIQFPTMLGAGDNMLLSSARVVTAPYPLRGEMVTQPSTHLSLPEPGTAWVEPRILSQLGINIGESVQFGYADLKITAELLSSPDRGSGFNSLNPHIIVNHADLERSAVLAPGSRAAFRLLIAGEESSVAKYENAVRPTLSSNERILSLVNDQPVTGNALANGLGYLRLSAMTTLLLASLTILLALRRFGQAQLSRSALLMSLGMAPATLIKLYLWQLTLAATIIALIGTAIGTGLAVLANIWLADLLPQALPSADLYSYFIGAGLGYAMLILLGIPPVLQQAGVPVAQLLRADSEIKTTRSAIAINALSLTLLALVLLAFLGAPLAAAIMLGVLAISGILFGWVAQWLLHSLGYKLSNRVRLGRLLRMRFKQQRRWHRLQAGVMVLLLMLISVMWIAREDLLKSWAAQFPEDTPNYFAINIQDWQKPELDQFLTERSIKAELSPMIRGRVIELNDQPIKSQLNEAQQDHNSLRRELNLTYSTNLPTHNQLIQGSWWSDDKAQEISIEREMFDTLGLQLGDKLGFDIGGRKVTAEITSVRSLEWTSFRPNFYIIFSPGALTAMPATYITSFNLDESSRHYAVELLRQFPSLTLIDIDQMLEQLSGWLTRLAESSTLVLLLTLGSGLILVTVTLLQALDQRRIEVALLQTLGANAQETKQLDLLEFGLLGLVCGFLAVFSAESTLAAIHYFVLKLEPTLHVELWIALPIISALLFLLIGSLLRSPLKIEQCYQILKSGG